MINGHLQSCITKNREDPYTFVKVIMKKKLLNSQNLLCKLYRSILLMICLTSARGRLLFILYLYISAFVFVYCIFLFVCIFFFSIDELVNKDVYKMSGTFLFGHGVYVLYSVKYECNVW